MEFHHYKISDRKVDDSSDGTFFDALQKLKNSQLFADIIVGVRGGKFCAHGPIMAMNSAFFAKLLKNEGTNCSYVGILKDKVSEEAMHLVLTLIYERVAIVRDCDLYEFKMARKYFEIGKWNQTTE